MQQIKTEEPNLAVQFLPYQFSLKTLNFAIEHKNDINRFIPQFLQNSKK